MARPEHGIVEVLGRDQKPIGLGFLVGDLHVLTCAHVINDALGRETRESSRPGSVHAILLRYPFADGDVVRSAHVKAWLPQERETFDYADVCGLVLSEAIPGPGAAMTLADEGTDPDDVQMWGPSPVRETGGHVVGQLMGAVDAVRYQVDQQLGGVFVARAGFSGGPVWSRTTQQVVGMLQAVGGEDVYVINPAVLIQAWPDVLFRPPPCPYIGLRAFDESNRDSFFGRNQFVQTLVDDAVLLPLVVVMGPSGSGKSSVIDAGLVPRLKEQGGTAAIRMLPGRQPFRALARAFAEASAAPLAEWQERLRRHGLRHCAQQFIEDAGLGRLVLVVDQVEQIITSAQPYDPEEVSVFFGLLAELVAERHSQGRPYLVGAMSIRSDFFGQFITMAREDIGEYVKVHARTLRPMSEDELRQAIMSPVKYPITIRDSLVERLCGDFRGRHGELPLLQFALTRLWEQQRGRELSLESYHQIGGVSALGRYADERIELMSDAESAFREHMPVMSQCDRMDL
ncbi:trypsin-like peptidase domain-containing protein [Acrocarpospora sp. B8E8]|uniref:trypsin-like serine peptidase n=1 Tax=Acrocarpospora sp. B8E8 TaxID=3153572 RepID=UPI00325DECB0